MSMKVDCIGNPSTFGIMGTTKMGQWEAHDRETTRSKAEPLRGTTVTSEELQEMSKHAQYEIDEFRNAIQRLDEIEETDADWNSTIELTLMHIRNLRDFFVSENSGRADDLLARHYIATWNPPIDQV